MARIYKKLTLDPKAVERGERWCQRHSTSLSQLVSDFLSQLPLDEDEPDLPPVVRRLLGVAKGGPDEDDYREYLFEKYSQ